MKANELADIRKLVGKVTPEQLQFVDCFAAEKVGVFLPVAGPCYYAVTPEHTHPAYMFLQMFDDQTEVVLEHERVRSIPGKLYALSPGIRHHEVFTERPPKYIAILIDKDFFNQQMNCYTSYPIAPLFNEFYIPSPTLLPLLRRFMVEADEKGPGSSAVLLGLSLEICHAVIRSIVPTIKHVDKITERLEIIQAVEYIHLNLAKKMAVDQMAQVANMSVSHFTRIFKKEMGETPLSYLKRCRLELVKKLLNAGEQSMTSIALECGFNSSSYLSTVFYQTYGLTPTEFQHQLHDGQILKKHGRKLKASKSVSEL